MATYYRDERAAHRQPALVPTLSQRVDEGYRIVGPGATLTPVVVHVQWLDNHPAGPDTHVMISFEDGTTVEFPFDTPLTAVWHDERRPVAAAELAAAAPTTWGTPAEPWR
ncbi:hypothetical protein ACIQMJ_27160 [Actinosynnema sp. NPDC091369]